MGGTRRELSGRVDFGAALPDGGNGNARQKEMAGIRVSDRYFLMEVPFRQFYQERPARPLPASSGGFSPRKGAMGASGSVGDNRRHFPGGGAVEYLCTRPIHSQVHGERSGRAWKPVARLQTRVGGRLILDIEID